MEKRQYIKRGVMGIILGVIASGIASLFKTKTGIGPGLPIYLFIVPTITSTLVVYAFALLILDTKSAQNENLGRIESFFLLIVAPLFVGLLAGMGIGLEYNPQIITGMNKIIAISGTAFFGAIGGLIGGALLCAAYGEAPLL